MKRWHEGRTFYACLCGAQEEHDRKSGTEPPDVIDCWDCKRLGSMRQWVPPAVKREREEDAALAAQQEGRLL